MDNVAHHATASGMQIFILYMLQVVVVGFSCACSSGPKIEESKETRSAEEHSLPETVATRAPQKDAVDAVIDFLEKLTL